MKRRWVAPNAAAEFDPCAVHAYGLAVLRSARRAQRISQELVAQHLGVSRTHYVFLENGDKAITWADALKVAQFLGLDPYTLLPPRPHDTAEAIALVLRQAYPAVFQDGLLGLLQLPHPQPLPSAATALHAL